MLDPSLSTTTAEPAYCPSCGLRYTRRSDWLCPRCGSPVESGVAPPRAEPSQPEEEGFPAGARIAGALLVVSGGALATAWANPFSVLVPMFSLGMAALWGARHGTYPARPAPVAVKGGRR